MLAYRGRLEEARHYEQRAVDAFHHLGDPRMEGVARTYLAKIALFSGEPLYAVISAGSHQDAWLGSEQWCEDLWPTESPLVHFDFAIPAPRVRRRLRGVGDFRDVRRELRLVWSR